MKYRFRKIIECLLLMIVAIAGMSFFVNRKSKPVFYIIGDSTVRNGDGTGKNQQWGWGSFIVDYFDTTKIEISNQAIGGRSSRTFITEGRWDRIMNTLKKGDFLIIQFGHNDAGPLDDTARARGTIKGIGEESKEIYNPITKKQEVVHTYGWYMKKYLGEAKSKGVIPIVCSPVPRDNWQDGKINRTTTTYTLWARQVAEEENAFFIDLNEKIALKYEEMGQEKVKKYFPVDHTHTDLEGARLNAEVVIDAIRQIQPGKLTKYLKK